jgi:hypothetical protein
MKGTLGTFAKDLPDGASTLPIVERSSTVGARELAAAVDTDSSSSGFSVCMSMTPRDRFSAASTSAASRLRLTAEPIAMMVRFVFPRSLIAWASWKSVRTRLRCAAVFAATLGLLPGINSA